MHRLTVTLLCGVALLAGCAAEETDPAADEAASSAEGADTDAGGEAGEGADDASGFPVEITDARGEPVTIEERPEQIVSLSATHTEMLFDVGAGEQVAAVDEQSNYPEQAPTTDLSGFEPNVEAILEHEPDLVVLGFDPGDVATALEDVGVDVLLYPDAGSLDDAWSQMMAVGEATGNADEAAERVDELEARVDEIVEQAPEGVDGLTYFHELDENLYTVTSDTFIGDVYGQLGLTSVADEAAGDAGNYPQLSSEAVVEADPDLVFLADAELGQTPEVVADRPGWETITAVEQDALIPVDSDLASRWGPRIVDYLEDVAGELDRVAGDAS